MSGKSADRAWWDPDALQAPSYGRSYTLSSQYIANPGGARLDVFLRPWSEFNDALDANALAPLAREKMGRIAGLAIRGIAPMDNC